MLLRKNVGKRWMSGVATILTVVLSLSSASGVAFAKGDNRIKKSEKRGVNKSYYEEQLEGYLTGGGFTSEDNLKVSQKFLVDESTEVSYVFCEDDIIGSYTETEIDGQKFSSFTFDSVSDANKSVYEERSEIDETMNGNPSDEKSDKKSAFEPIQKAFEKGKKIGFNQNKKGNICFIGKKAEFISGEKDGQEYTGSKESYKEQEKIVVNDISEQIEMPESNTNRVVLNASKDIYDYYKGASWYADIDYYSRTKAFLNSRVSNISDAYFLAVPMRNNYDADTWSILRNTLSEDGICWSACGASILSYKGKNYTTKGLYNYILSNYYPYYYRLFKETPIKPCGIYNYEKIMFDYIGGLSYSYSDVKINDDVIKKNLKNKYPIYLAMLETGDYNVLTTSDDEDSYFYEASGHAIVLCGRYKYNKKVYYVYMDPNNSGYTVNSVPTKFLQSNYKEDAFYYVDANGNPYCRWLGTWSRYVK